MTTLKKLFEVVEENIDRHSKGVSGLCYFILRLYRLDIISKEEWVQLDNYILGNRPTWPSRHYSIWYSSSVFWWRPYRWRPRRRWIKAQIKKLS